MPLHTPTSTLFDLTHFLAQGRRLPQPEYIAQDSREYMDMVMGVALDLENKGRRG